MYLYVRTVLSHHTWYVLEYLSLVFLFWRYSFRWTNIRILLSRKIILLASTDRDKWHHALWSCWLVFPSILPKQSCSILLELSDWRIHACHACIQKNTHIYIYIYNMYIYIYIHIYVSRYIGTYIHTYMHACMHACIHACIHTYMHACIHTCMHAYIHTYAFAYASSIGLEPHHSEQWNDFDDTVKQLHDSTQ